MNNQVNEKNLDAEYTRLRKDMSNCYTPREYIELANGFLSLNHKNSDSLYVNCMDAAVSLRNTYRKIYWIVYSICLMITIGITGYLCYLIRYEERFMSKTESYQKTFLFFFHTTEYKTMFYDTMLEHIFKNWTSVLLFGLMAILLILHIALLVLHAADLSIISLLLSALFMYFTYTGLYPTGDIGDKLVGAFIGLLFSSGFLCVAQVLYRNQMR